MNWRPQVTSPRRTFPTNTAGQSQISAARHSLRQSHCSDRPHPAPPHTKTSWMSDETYQSCYTNPQSLALNPLTPLASNSRSMLKTTVQVQLFFVNYFSLFIQKPFFALSTPNTWTWIIRRNQPKNANRKAGSIHAMAKKAARNRHPNAPHPEHIQKRPYTSAHWKNPTRDTNAHSCYRLNKTSPRQFVKPENDNSPLDTCP